MANRHDRGQALPVVVLLLAVTALAVLAVERTTVAASDRARAQVAADAAALGGAAEGRSGAVRLAARNGARLLSFVEEGTVVTVRVAVGGAEATARARRSWEACVPAAPC